MNNHLTPYSTQQRSCHPLKADFSQSTYIGGFPITFPNEEQRSPSSREIPVAAPKSTSAKYRNHALPRASSRRLDTSRFALQRQECRPSLGFATPLPRPTISRTRKAVFARFFENPARFDEFPHGFEQFAGDCNQFAPRFNEFANGSNQFPTKHIETPAGLHRFCSGTKNLHVGTINFPAV
jgi:hypothetical protein